MPSSILQKAKEQAAEKRPTPSFDDLQDAWYEAVQNAAERGEKPSELYMPPAIWTTRTDFWNAVNISESKLSSRAGQSYTALVTYTEKHGLAKAVLPLETWWTLWHEAMEVAGMELHVT